MNTPLHEPRAWGGNGTFKSAYMPSSPEGAWQQLNDDLVERLRSLGVREKVVVGVLCTRGRHRSVAAGMLLAAAFTACGHEARVSHYALDYEPWLRCRHRHCTLCGPVHPTNAERAAQVLREAMCK